MVFSRFDSSRTTKLNTMTTLYDEIFEILVDLYEGIYPGNGDEWIDAYSAFLNDRTYDEIIKIES